MKDYGARKVYIILRFTEVNYGVLAVGAHLKDSAILFLV